MTRIGVRWWAGGLLVYLVLWAIAERPLAFVGAFLGASLVTASSRARRR